MFTKRFFIFLLLLLVSFLLFIFVPYFLGLYKIKIGLTKVPSCDSLNKISFTGTNLSSISTVKEDQQYLEKLRKFASKQSLQKENLQTAIKRLIKEVSPSYMFDVYGVSCGPYGFVRNNLPLGAKEFVKYHEIVHLVHPSFNSVLKRELFANYQAAIHHPLGFLQLAIINSLNFFGKPKNFLLFF